MGQSMTSALGNNTLNRLMTEQIPYARMRSLLVRVYGEQD